jgi:site-specific DNA-methyltransferase (adenine-specific)
MEDKIIKETAATLENVEERPFLRRVIPSAEGKPHILIRGDSTDRHVLKKESVDLTVTSPPYNLGMAYSGDGADDELDYKEYLKFSKAWLSNCYNWTKPTGRLCLNIGLDKNKGGKRPTCADLTNIAMQVGWNYHATIIWNEGNISRRTAWGSWLSASAPHVIAPVEVIIVLHKGEWKRERQGENDITADEFKEWVLGTWTFNGESAKRVGHEAPFPAELPKRCIKLFSFKGDTVLDPFMGSGTTMIESIRLDRKVIGIERESHYCELIRKRVYDACGIEIR